jgi:GntR family transcriptional regulator of arabinose operon
MKTSFKYIRVYEELRAKIRSGQYGPGDKLPSEQDLAKDYGLNFLTIRKSLKLLEADGLLTRRVGLGSFVLSPAGKAGDGGVASEGGARRGVAVLIEPDPGVFTMRLIEEMDEICLSKGHFLNIRPIKSLDESALRVARHLVRQGSVAVIVPRFAEPNPALTARFVAACPVPVVIPELFPGLERNCSYRPDSIGYLDYSLMYLAFHHFKGQAFRNIAYFGPLPGESLPGDRRLQAYRDLMSQFGLAAYEGLVGASFLEVDALVEQWRAVKGRLAAICYDDHHALRLMTSLHKHGLAIPDDIALLGANNSPECLCSDPPLSSIEFPYRELAAGMLDHALAMSAGFSRQIRATSAGSLVIRES